MTIRSTSTRLAAPPETLDDDPPVATVMTTDLVAIDAEARLPTALHIMNTARVRHLPVVEHGRRVGMLVEADLVRLLARLDTGPGEVTAVSGAAARVVLAGA